MWLKGVPGLDNTRNAREIKKIVPDRWACKWDVKSEFMATCSGPRVKLVAGTGTRDHITPVLQNLHWLPDQLPHYLQALRAHAPGASWSQPWVPVGHDDIRRWPAWSWETEILQQLPIWTSTVETKVRRAGVSPSPDQRHGFSSVQSPGTHKHWYFQKLLKTHL